MKIKLTENKLKLIVNESIKNVLKEGRLKKIPKSINIDGVDYEKTDVKGGGMLHPGFRWKDHEMHNPEKSKQFRKRKDGYRYAQSYDGSPRWIHNQLTTESSYDSNGNFDEVGHENDIIDSLLFHIDKMTGPVEKEIHFLSGLAISSKYRSSEIGRKLINLSLNYCRAVYELEKELKEMKRTGNYK